MVWKNFDPHEKVLVQGDRIRFSPHISTRKLQGQIGIIVRLATKNYKVTVNGNPWSLSPYDLHEWRPATNAEKLKDIEQAASGIRLGQPFVTSPENFVADNVQKGDVILLSIGSKVHISRFEGMTTSGQIRATQLSNDKRYLYKLDFYVCKIPSDRIVS